MTVRVNKDAFNIREKLSELDYGHVPYDKMPAGSIIQVKRESSNSSNQTPSGLSTWTDVNPTVTITPKRASNLIIIETSVMCISQNNSYVGFRLLRDSTAIREWWGFNDTSSFTPFQGPGKHIDSPNTTSAVTYKFQIFASSGTNTHFMWNYQGNTSSNSLRNAELYAMELVG